MIMDVTIALLYGHIRRRICIELLNDHALETDSKL